MADEILYELFYPGAERNLPKGPTFIDDEDCTCALQEKLSTEAYRCISNLTFDIYSGPSGKWFFANDQFNPASLHDPYNSSTNPPNVTASYLIEGEGQDEKFVSTKTYNKTEYLEYFKCSGKNDTNSSSLFYDMIATSMVTSRLPCWQPGTKALVMQNASLWNATGCNLGFFCKRTWKEVRREAF